MLRTAAGCCVTECKNILRHNDIGMDTGVKCISQRKSVIIEAVPLNQQTRLRFDIKRKMQDTEKLE
jgi:hypothetical protein